MANHIAITAFRHGDSLNAWVDKWGDDNNPIRHANITNPAELELAIDALRECTFPEYHAAHQKPWAGVDYAKGSDWTGFIEVATADALTDRENGGVVEVGKGSDWTGIVETVTVDGVTEVVNDKVVKPKSNRRLWLAFWLLVVLGSAALVVFNILTGVTVTGPTWAVIVYLVAFGAQNIGAYELWRRC